LTIKQEVRAKVISLFKDGIGRNRIAFETGVSAASVTNILREIKNKDITTIDSSQTQEIDFSYQENYPGLTELDDLESKNNLLLKQIEDLGR
jgi:DNA-binding transcriptional regulator LsrR (DeoR family)